MTAIITARVDLSSFSRHGSVSMSLADRQGRDWCVSMWPAGRRGEDLRSEEKLSLSASFTACLAKFMDQMVDLVGSCGYAYASRLGN